MHVKVILGTNIPHHLERHIKSQESLQSQPGRKFLYQSEPRYQFNSSMRKSLGRPLKRFPVLLGKWIPRMSVYLFQFSLTVSPMFQRKAKTQEGGKAPRIFSCNQCSPAFTENSLLEYLLMSAILQPASLTHLLLCCSEWLLHPSRDRSSSRWSPSAWLALGSFKFDSSSVTQPCLPGEPCGTYFMTTFTYKSK